MSEPKEASAISERFWKASIEELKRGWVWEERGRDQFCVCLICGESFEKGLIYKHGPVFCDAEKYASLHLTEAHGSMFEYLLGLDKKQTGLTELQKGLLQAFRQGTGDAEAARALGIGSTSTVRNHRFTLREKAKQAKLFLAVMELSEEESAAPQFVTFPRTASVADERLAITEKENEEIIWFYFKEGPEGPLSEFPKKQKRKAAILRHLLKRFEPGRTYTEKEINSVLKEAFPDYVTLRRYMIDYGLIDREPDGSRYWVRL
ncbi:DUF2087 domain-containing protein [Paenibacillus sp. CN-4]|uniref:DUF2087 domain-containing protein n=1 Tax=Paenibacillus nanchangensis TaxID=3348343 RepID=UPI00397D50A8